MSKDAKEFDNTLKPLRERALDIGKAMSLTGGAVVTAFAAMTKQAANYGDRIRDASIRTGISTQALSGLKFAAEQTGTSFEEVSGSLSRMTRSALSAAAGSKEGARVFKALGVSVKDASGQLRPMEDILGDVAEKFSKMKDGTEKAAVAQLLFGRNGAQMIEFLNQGREGMEAFQDRAEELGLVVGPEFAANADAFNDSINEMKNAQLGFSNTIAQVLLPSLTKVVNIVTGAIIEFRKFAEAHPAVIKAVAVLAGLLTGAGGLILGLAGVLAILPKLAAAFTLLLGPVGLATVAVGALVAAFLAFPKFREVVLMVLGRVTEAVAFLTSYIGSLGAVVWKLATGQWREAWSIMSNSVDRAFKDTADAGNFFRETVNGVSNALKFTAPPTMDLSKAMEGLGIDLSALTTKTRELRDEWVEFRNKTDDLKAAILNVIPVSAAFSAALTELQTTGKITKETLGKLSDGAKDALSFITALRELDSTGSLSAQTILNLKNKLEELKNANDPLIDKYRELIPWIEMANDNLRAQTEIEERLAEVHRTTAAAFPSFLRQQLPDIPPPALFDPKALTPSLDDIEDNVRRVGEEIAQLQEFPATVIASAKALGDQGYSTKQIMAALGDDILKLRDVSRDLGIPLDENTRRLIKQAEAAARSREQAKRWEQAWVNAVGNVVSAFAEKTVEGLFAFGVDIDKVESIEKQITNIKNEQERARLQKTIDTARKTSRAYFDAQKAMQAFEARINQERDAERSRELSKLQSELENQTNLFRRFTNGVKNLFVELAKSIVKIMVTEAFTKVAQAFTDTLLKPITEKLAGLFGGVAKAGSAAGVLGQGAGGVASAAGGVAAAGSSIAGGLISGGLAAVGSIVGALMTKGNLKRSEENTRETRDWLELAVTAWNPLFHKMTFFQEGIEKNTAIMIGRTQTGWHMDNPVSRMAPLATGSTINAPFNFAPVIHIQPGANPELTDMDIRDAMEKITTALDTGVRGYREKWAQLLVGDPFGTQAPVGI